MSSTAVALRNHIIHDAVMRGCNAADLLRLMRTSKTLEATTRNFIRRAYDVHKPLRHFFRDPVGFRTMQYETGAIVSGSFALQFFTRSYYSTADLDIYVCRSGGERVGKWLLQNGYTYVPAEKEQFGKVLKQPSSFEDAISSLNYAWIPDEFYCKGVMGVLNFENSVDGDERKVQLIMTEVCPMRTILNFHSTCVMNFITYNKAYCLYPRETIEKSISLVLTDYTDEVYMAMLKYDERGFTFYDIVDEKKGDFKYREVRWVEDKWSWVLSLEDIGIGSGVFDPTRITTWSILTVPSEHHRIHTKILYTTNEDPVRPIMVATTLLRTNIKRAWDRMVERNVAWAIDARSKERNTQMLFEHVYDLLLRKKW